MKRDHERLVSTREVLHIFAKDARQLWWLLASVFALNFGWLVSVLQDPTDPSGGISASDWRAWFVFAQAGPVPLSIGALVIHQDSLLGGSPFWKTRPVRRASLFAAKTLFIVLFGLFTPTTVHFAALAWHGLPPTLAVTQTFEWAALPTFLLLAGALLASVTEDVLQFLAGLVIAPVVLLTISPIGWVLLDTPIQPIDSIAYAQRAALLVLATFAALYIQFQTGKSVRTVVAACILIWAASAVAINRQAAARVELTGIAPFSCCAPDEAGGDAVRVEFPDPRDGIRVEESDSQVYIVGDVRVSGLASGYTAGVTSCSSSLYSGSELHSIEWVTEQDSAWRDTLAEQILVHPAMGTSGPEIQRVRLGALTKGEYRALAEKRYRLYAHPRVAVMRHEVLGRMPLREGAAFDAGPIKAQIEKVTLGADGEIQVVARLRKFRGVALRRFPELRFFLFHSRMNQMLSPAETRDFGSSPEFKIGDTHIEFSSRASVYRLVPTLESEPWLDDGELVVVAPGVLSEFDVSIVVDDVLLAALPAGE